MADLVIVEMTKKEAEAEIAAFAGDWKSARSRLLNMFEGKAHKILGYQTFEEFAQDRLGINVSDSTIKKHLAAARVDRNLSVLHSNKSVNITLFAALELSKLPASEQPDAWEEVRALDKFGTHLPKDVARATRDIVTRRLNTAQRQIDNELAEGTREDAEAEERDRNEAPPSPAARFVPAHVSPKPAVVVTPIAPVAPVRVRPNLTPIVPPTYDGTPEQQAAEAETEKPVVETAPVAVAPTQAEDPMSAADCISAIALSFVVTFDKIMRNGGSLEELHMDVIAFRKKYSV